MDSNRFWRQLDLCPPEKLQFPVTVIGAGAIGSATVVTPWLSPFRFAITTLLSAPTSAMTRKRQPCKARLFLVAVHCFVSVNSWHL
jgi:hypothetical protein